MLFLKTSNFSFVADIFAAAFLSKNSGSFTTYSFSRETVKKFGSKRAAQRFEQCLRFLEIEMRPGLEALSAEKFYDKTVQKSATELVTLALNDTIDDISENEMISNETKDILTRKLKSTTLWVMTPDDVLNLTKIGALYSELAFDESESSNKSHTLIDLQLSILKHNQKLRLQPQNNWMRILATVVKYHNPTYFPELNILSE